MKYKATLTLDVTADSEQEAFSNAWEQLHWGEGHMSVEVVVEAEENGEEGENHER